MYRFNDTFEALGYIKELLKEFNLPSATVYTDDLPLYDGALYVKDLGIYRYNKHDDHNHWPMIRDYYYNRPILNITTNLNLTYSYYSTDFHEYLGNYLRFQRDYRGLNLMPLYNCFSNRVVFPKNYDENYNYYAVPVKFNRTYTIGFDSSTPVKMWCTLWNNAFIEGTKGGEFITPEIIKDLEAKTTKIVHGSCIDKPFIYTQLKDFDASKFINHFNDLKLIIQMPVSNKTSITVLEGDYIYNTTIGGSVTTEMIHSKKENKTYHRHFPTELSLFKVNDEQQHPFADRLIEYLLDEAVTNLDNLEDNIKRVQEYLIYLVKKGPKILYGVWDDKMNDSIYEISKNSVVNDRRYNTTKRDDIYLLNSNSEMYFTTTKNLIDTKPDLLMYMDKDVEELFLATGLNDKYTR